MHTRLPARQSISVTRAKQRLDFECQSRLNKRTGMSLFPRPYHIKNSLAMALLDPAALSRRDLCGYSQTIYCYLKDIKMEETVRGSKDDNFCLSEEKVEENAKRRREQNAAKRKKMLDDGIPEESIEDHFTRLAKEREALSEAIVSLTNDYEYALVRLADRFEDTYMALLKPRTKDTMFDSFFYSQRKSL